jgi:hypothetical protein
MRRRFREETRGVARVLREEDGAKDKGDEEKERGRRGRGGGE